MAQQERNVVIPSSAHFLTSSSGLRDRFDPPGTGLTRVRTLGVRTTGGLGGYTGVRDRFDHPETGLTHVRTLGVRTTGGLEGCTGARDWGELSSYNQVSVGAL